MPRSSYSRMYVTLQDDGSEDDLSYIKLYNYGSKVVTNRMHGYLRMRIAQFLTTVHTTPHVIYLSRHGQSEYNVLGKIGGNPPLSDCGAEYARRLGEWVPTTSAARRMAGRSRAGCGRPRSSGRSSPPSTSRTPSCRSATSTTRRRGGAVRRPAPLSAEPHRVA